jgi:hypothetical protein
MKNTLAAVRRASPERLVADATRITNRVYPFRIATVLSIIWPTPLRSEGTSPMKETPDAGQIPRFDPIQFAISRALASPQEMAVGFGQLIDSIGDLTGSYVDRVITPGLSAVTVSWLSKSVPSEDWLHNVEDQLQAFAACAGVDVRFRRH